MKDIAIKVENISKIYRLGSRGTGTLSRDIESSIKKIWNNKLPEVPNSEFEKEYIKSIDDISFEIKKGETVGIIGKNGAGKSTLLKILSKITTPSSGIISGNGRVASLLEVGTGFHPELTGKENIFLNGAILGMKKHEIEKNFDEIVNFSGIESYLDTPVKRYSSGMYVRLAFSVAAHLESEILIVDEVLAVGDAEFQKKCLGKMNSISQTTGKTILFVSHNMSSIQSICPRSILLNNGKLIKDGKSESVISEYLKVNSNIIPIHQRMDRKGDQLIKLLSLEIIPSNIGQTKHVTSGNNLAFKLVIQKTDGPNLGQEIAIGINDSYGNKISLISNKREGKEIILTNGENTIYIEINKLPFVIGNYFLTTFISTGSIIHDWVQDAFVLKVEADSYFKETVGSMPAGQGSFYLDYTFQSQQF